MDRKKTKRMCLRVIGIACVMAMCITLFAGCNQNFSAEDYAKLEEDFINLNGELGTLENDYEEALQKNEDLQNDNDAAKAEIEKLKSENEQAQEDHAAESAALKAEIEALKAANDAVMEELEIVKDQFNGLLEHIKANSSEEKIRIYIDQGHNPTNYHNSGAIGNGLYEQDLTFTVGRLLAGNLLLDGRFEVCLSRPAQNTVLGSDNEDSLEARVLGAQEFEADYFISLHANSYSDANVKGCEVWVFGSDKTSESYKLGSSVLAGIIASTEMNNRGMKETTSLYVLKNATMPAVLVEMGFITNEGDATLMNDSPELFADGIYNGILAYFGLEAK